jgi:hypothetical protein
VDDVVDGTVVDVGRSVDVVDDRSADEGLVLVVSPVVLVVV